METAVQTKKRFRVTEAAIRNDVHAETIRAAIRNRQLEAIIIGKPGSKRPTYRITLSALERWEEACTRKATIWAAPT